MRSPNILFLLTDQQRADTIAACGNPQIKTPVLDRLVREGTTFERAYTPSPVCVSARFGLITGMAPHRSGIVDNMPFPKEARSIMQVLTECGYQTHGTGKMHFTGGDPRRKWGFESRDFSEEVHTDDDFADHLRAKGYGHVIDTQGVRSEYYYIPQPSQLPAELHHTNWVADRSIDFLKRRDRSRPFFLWSSFIKPHPPFESPNPWGRLYRSAEMPDPVLPGGSDEHMTFWNRVQNRYKYMDGGTNSHLQRTQRAAYYGAISFIDHAIGRILAELGAEADNTLIVFSSDHGELLGDFGCYGKRSMLEASARVPLVVRYPARYASGVRCAAPVSLLDLFPTFATAAGAQDEASRSSGAELAAIARGEVARTQIISQFSQRSLGLYLMAESDWKYIYSAADRREWLFNTRRDPQELRNLAHDAASRPALERLKAALIGQFASDRYDWAVRDGQWRDYEAPVFPRDPRSGLLFQDPVELGQELARLAGYERPRATSPNLLQATSPEAMDPLTGAVSLPQ
jgi:choline-sulfatase